MPRGYLKGLCQRSTLQISSCIVLLLQICMPSPHLCGRLSQFVAEHNGNEIEKNELSSFVKTSHWEQAGGSGLIISHGLGRKVGDSVSLSRRGSIGLGCNDHNATSR